MYKFSQQLVLRRVSEAGICQSPFTQYNRLLNRLYNRIDNGLYRVNGVSEFSVNARGPPLIRRPESTTRQRNLLIVLAILV